MDAHEGRAVGGVRAKVAVLAITERNVRRILARMQDQPAHLPWLAPERAELDACDDARLGEGAEVGVRAALVEHS